MTSSPGEAGFVTINGAPIYYEVSGEGDPLVLLHAGVADSRMWDSQVEAFARRYRVIRYDLRGFGKSEVPADHFAQHEELTELLAHLHATRAHVVGISYGGKVALDFTLAHPELVAKLILVAPSIGGTEPTADVLEFYEAEEQALEAGDLEGATELNVKMWVDGPRRTPGEVNPAVRELVREMQLHAFQTIFPEGAVERDLEPPAAARLGEVQAPTLIIVGDYDIQAKLDLAQQLQTEIAGAQLAIVPGVAHMVNLEKPAEFNQLVLDFLG
jgi:3-oxoadipate enol-lactonase